MRRAHCISTPCTERPEFDCHPSLPTNSMSSDPHRDTSPHFLAIFDVALKEYSKTTGNNIIEDPLIDKLKSCSSPEDVLGILQEQSQAFNDFRNGAAKVQLMRKKLKPTVDILFSLSNSGVLVNGIGLVSIRFRISSVWVSKFSSHRHFRLHLRSLPESGSYSQCVFHFLDDS